MKNTIMGLYLTAIVLGTSFNAVSSNNSYVALTESTQQIREKSTPCASDARVKKVVARMRAQCAPKSVDTYILDVNPQSIANSTSRLAGQFTVYVMNSAVDKPRISIFDRSDNNPANWYNVSASANYCGCSNWGINLTTGAKLSPAESQNKFNEAISKMERLLSEK